MAIKANPRALAHPVRPAATQRHSLTQRAQQAEGAVQRRRKNRAPESLGHRRRRSPPPSPSSSPRRSSRHREPSARHQLTTASPTFNPATTGESLSPQRPLPRRRERRRARSPWVQPPPPDAGTNTPWVEPRCLLSRAPRSPRTHAAYAPSATRRPRPSGHARGRGRREHEHSRRTPRSGLRAILEDPGTQSASSPRPGTYGAHTFS